MSDNKFADRQVYRIHINAPVESVWSEIVNTTSPRPFFFGAVCDTPGFEPGAPYRMISKNGKYASVVGRVLEMSPPNRLVQSFKFTTMDDPPCKVIYELKAVDNGTEFTLTTENVPAGTKTEKSMAQGGTFITQNLKSFIESGHPTTSGRMVLFMIKLMTPFSPAAAKIEHWPYEQLK